MSKPSRRPNRETIKAQIKERKKAQRELRESHKAAGLEVPTRPSIANRKCPYKNVEEEKAGRLEAVSQQVKVYRAMFPGFVEAL